jgi:transcriptional regulator GlxA family with amidase domain
MESLLPVIDEYLANCVSRNEVPRVVELSRRIGVSSWSFTRRFERLHGTPPGDYLRRAQLSRAKDLLRTTPLPIHVIATAAGYSCTRTLHRSFRRATGITPDEYRRRERHPAILPSSPEGDLVSPAAGMA